MDDKSQFQQVHRFLKATIPIVAYLFFSTSAETGSKLISILYHETNFLQTIIFIEAGVNNYLRQLSKQF